MRYSKQRELVMQTVQNLCDHPTAEEIYDAAVKECPGLSLGTVYRNLNSLVDAGRVRRVSIPGKADRFDHTLPWHSQSIDEFWRRWHISLGAWLKEYVFYPVSLSGHFKKVNTFTKKHIKSQHIVGFITIAYTLFFVWFCNGLWHGASWLYIVYGLYYYVLMMLGKFTEPYTDKLAKKLHINKESKGYSVFQVARTVVIVNVGMLLFRSSTLVEFGKLFGKMFTSINFMDFCSIIKIQDGIILAVGFVVMLLVGIIKEKGIDIRMWLIEHNFVIRWLVYYFLLFSTIILVLMVLDMVELQQFMHSFRR